MVCRVRAAERKDELFIFHLFSHFVRGFVERVLSCPGYAEHSSQSWISHRIRDWGEARLELKDTVENIPVQRTSTNYYDGEEERT